MSVHDLSSESDLEKILESSNVLVIDFWSPVCPPCKAFAPVFQAASERHPQVAFCRVNTREEETLSTAFEVEHVPTLVVIKDRVLVASQPGYLTGDQMDDLLRQVDDLDTSRLFDEGTGAASGSEEGT